MTSVDAIASSAFLGGWMHTLSNLPTTFPHLTNDVSLLLSTDNVSKILADIHQAVESTGCDDSQHLSEFVKQPKKLQQNLSSQLHETNANSCLETSISQSDRAAAKFRSIRGKGAGSWLEVIPTEEILALKPHEFRLAASLRLDMPAPFVNWNIQCECGKLANEYHLLTCKHGGGPAWQHDEIVNAWSTCLHELKIHYEKEPRHRYSGNENRPDIVVYDSGCSYDLDVAMAHPFSQDALKQAALEEGFAAARREERKMIKYEKQQLAGNTSSLNFTPLVFEHFGTWGSEATNYLNKLARRSRDIEGYTHEADFRGFWREKILNNITTMQR